MFDIAKQVDLGDEGTSTSFLKGETLEDNLARSQRLELNRIDGFLPAYILYDYLLVLGSAFRYLMVIP